ncbi:hypothetical protein GCM10008909_08110 [Hathewaya limosa]
MILLIENDTIVIYYCIANALIVILMCFKMYYKMNENRKIIQKKSLISVSLKTFSI